MRDTVAHISSGSSSSEMRSQAFFFYYMSSTEIYTAGVYSSPVTLGDTVVDVTVTVDPDRIKAIDLNNLSETTSTMYPLIRPAVEELEAQILEKQSTKDITWEATGKYTAGILLNAIEKALDQAEGSVFSE